MIAIAGGRYVIGTDDGATATRPAHTVAIAPFSIDRTEVTNAAFAAFLNTLSIDPVADGGCRGGKR